MDGEWRKGVLAAVREYNQAMTYGFTQAEVDEQLARQRTGLENAVKAKETRNNAAFVGSALNLVSADVVPTTPEYRLELFESIAADITPERVFAAFKAHAIPLEEPLIRFQGRTAPEGGEEALRAAFAEGMALPIAPPEDTGKIEFAYGAFGDPGTIVSDITESQLGIRQIVFDNGVKLNLKSTDLREDRINVRVAVDGGSLMATKEDPLAVFLVSSLSAGGLGEHRLDDLSTILAGRSVGFGMGAGAETFNMSSSTTPRDLELQMQVFAALLTDPGYRAEGVEQFRRGIKNFFETLTSTPGRALGAVQGRELSDGDPRFSLQDKDAFNALDYEKLQAVISDRLARGAIEIALVGDFDEDAAIAAVASTFGALTEREDRFKRREAARVRSFTQDRSTRTVEHDGEPDQAILRMIFPARDDSDYDEVVKLQMLGRILRLELTDRIREELGQAYSPGAGVNLSSVYPDYGTISINVSLEDTQIEAARAAVNTLLTDMVGDGITQDLIERARKPLLERHENALKGLGTYTSLSSRAQSEPERIDRFIAYPDILNAVTIEDLKAAAAQYLKPEDAVTFLVVPSETAKAKADTKEESAGDGDTPAD